MTAQIYSIATRKPIPEPDSGVDQVGLELAKYVDSSYNIYLMTIANPEIIAINRFYLDMAEQWLAGARLALRNFEINQQKETTV